MFSLLSIQCLTLDLFSASLAISSRILVFISSWIRRLGCCCLWSVMSFYGVLLHAFLRFSFMCFDWFWWHLLSGLLLLFAGFLLCAVFVSFSFYGVFNWYVSCFIEEGCCWVPCGRQSVVLSASFKILCSFLVSSLVGVHLSYEYGNIWMIIVSTICHTACIFILFSCDQAALWMVQSVWPSVCPSVRPSVTPFWLCSHHPVIMKFSGVITSDKSDVHAKGQGQRSKVKVTEVTTQLNRFRTVTPV